MDIKSYPLHNRLTGQLIFESYPLHNRDLAVCFNHALFIVHIQSHFLAPDLVKQALSRGLQCLAIRKLATGTFGEEALAALTVKGKTKKGSLKDKPEGVTYPFGRGDIM